MTTTAPQTTVETLRTYDPLHRPADMANWYCSRCRCNKSGRADEPNGITEACDNPTCLCHRDLRCGCCDGHDGLGIHHFATVDDLRAWLATDHETVCDITIETVPDEPYGMEFVTAGEAAAWLDDHDETQRYELMYERRR